MLSFTVFIFIFSSFLFWRKRKNKNGITLPKYNPRSIWQEKQQRKKIILEELKGMRNFSSNQIEHLLGISNETAFEYLREFVDEGVVEKVEERENIILYRFKEK